MVAGYILQFLVNNGQLCRNVDTSAQGRPYCPIYIFITTTSRTEILVSNRVKVGVKNNMVSKKLHFSVSRYPRIVNMIEL